MALNQRMIAFEAESKESANLGGDGYIVNFGHVEEVLVHNPRAAAMVYLDPMLDQDGAVEVLEEVLRRVKSEKAWEFIQNNLRTGESG